MRPLRLDIDGFGTFRDPTVLDFSDTDYFALVGPTGSGKTSVIDALCFALYGAAPRWPRKNQISLAMAPSTGHTRVSLVFDVGGGRYAAVRTLARSARGVVSTKQSRLISLPPDLPVDGELGDLLDHEVNAIADAPASMEAAVEQLLGLTFEHFTQSVVLPQGGFAKFLHAEKRERQDLLVSLLGLGVYERVAQRANALAKEASTKAGVLGDELLKYADASEVAERDLADRLAAITGFEEDLRELMAPWLAAHVDLTQATQVAMQHERTLVLLAGLHPPTGLDRLSEQRTQAVAAVKAAATAETEVDEAEHVAEETVTASGEPATWRQLLAHHTRHGDLTRQQAEADATRALAEDTLAKATREADLAEAAVGDAQRLLDDVRIAHQADDLAVSLTAGGECPVCLQTVARVPERPPHAGLAEARTGLTAAEQARTTAATARAAAQRSHDRASDDASRLARELADIDSRLYGQPDDAAAQAGLAAAEAAAAHLATARQAARAAREAHRTARDAAQGFEDRWAEAGRDLVAARDRVATLEPPAVTGDHARDWDSLTEWAQAAAEALSTQFAEARARREQAEDVERRQRTSLAEALAGHGLAVPGHLTEVSVGTTVATAKTNAQRDLDRMQERRREAARIQDDMAREQMSENVHKELGSLLGARNFERWLVEEALQAMLVEASVSLLDLSGGQFELALDDRQDIQVIDHNDASSRRPVQTLSGGETFQASLALSLALSSQISALSPDSGRLDTILLDEGFGTLDPSSLDVVATTLEQLVGGGERTVGLVTHVTALAERVPVCFQVSREGSRSIVDKVWA